MGKVILMRLLAILRGRKWPQVTQALTGPLLGAPFRLRGGCAVFFLFKTLPWAVLGPLTWGHFP